MLNRTTLRIIQTFLPGESARRRRDMYQPKFEKDIRCPLEYGLDVFGGKWKSRIICVLAHQSTLQYSELRGEMANITDAMLVLNLKELMANGMVALM